MTALPRLEPGAVFAGDFVVEGRLAVGGMGAVYVVEQRSTGHRRALKVMHPDVVAEPRNRERFTQEARVGALIRSPYVVEVAAAGVDDVTGTPWLLMELLEGESLAERVARGALPDRATLREMFAQLSDALGRAHAVGVVHRDLKPENLFIAASRIRGVPFLMKVLDFGIAAIVSEQKRSATVTTVIGSPMWMAPEQADVGAQVGAQADVWALGLIAFYALTGRYFWPSLAGDRAAFNVAALLVDIVVHPIPKPSARAAALGVGERLPEGFDGWFARCVARDPAGRFPDARAALDTLVPLLGEATVSDPALGATLPVNASPPPAPAVSPVTMQPATASLAPAAPLALPTAPQALPTAPQAPPAALPAASQPIARTPPPRRWALVAAVAALTAVAVVAAVALNGSRTSARPPPVVAHATLPAQPDAAAAAPDVVAPAAPDAVVVAVVDATAVDAGVDATSAREGELAVTCSRRCQVSVDGGDRGVARRPFALAAGEHTVVATRGDRSLTQTVRVTAGETARVSFDFDEAPGDAGTTTPTPPVARPTTPVTRPTPPVARPTTPAAPLPDRPDRAAVESTFRDVTAAARRCGASGRVFVAADFSGEGRVTSAQVEGPLAGTPTGDCIVRAARRAQVPPFRRPTIRVVQALDL